MTIEKLSSGSYRIRQMHKGKLYLITVDHKPTKKEATILLAEKMQDVDLKRGNESFEKALDEYIDSKNNVLSPATIRGYKQLKNMYSDNFKKMNVYDMDQSDIQREVNRYAANHSPKSVRNFNGLISAVMALERPNMVIRTTLPQKLVIEAKVPTHEDVKKLIKHLENTEYHIAIQLACLGLRRSEICALDISDLEGNKLTINKAKVLDDNNKIVTKTTKTVSSTRSIYIPDTLAKEIRKTGYIYRGYPNSIIRALHRAQDELGIPRCKLHELRHFYVSYAHAQGMSDAAIMAAVGHKTDSITKRVYRHAMDVDSEEKRIASSIF